MKNRMQKKFYLTTAIDYVNGAPHIGHAVQKVWADIIARYHRLLGEKVWFLTGTDEHGANVVRTAASAGKSPKELADENSAKFRNFKEALNLSWDDFIRTSDEARHWPGVQEFWKRLTEAGDIYKSDYRGLYCLGHEAFITEKDLVDGKCKLHGREPEAINEENYFFRLSKYSGEIKERIRSGELQILPESRKNEILSLLEEGLEDVSFSRPSKDISWGVPVPGDATQTVYVWAEALINYLSAVGYGRNDDWQGWWPADLHVFGKDNLRFHAAIWPGMLMSAKLSLPRMLLCHGFIQVGGRKMSKTLGNVVDPFEIVKNFGTDALRYYFSREITIFEDGDFTEERFKETYEANLVNGLGNYVRRVATMIKNDFGGQLERPAQEKIDSTPLQKGELEYVSVPYFTDHVAWPEYHRAMENFEINRAADITFNLIKELDGYVQRYEPFKLVKTDQEKARAVLWNLAYGAVSLAWMLSPFLPETSGKILDIFGAEGERESEWKRFVVKDRPPLFPRIP